MSELENSVGEDLPFEQGEDRIAAPMSGASVESVAKELCSPVQIDPDRSDIDV